MFRWVFGNIDATDTGQKKLWSLLMVGACALLVARGFRWIERADRDQAAVDPVVPPRARGPREGVATRDRRSGAATEPGDEAEPRTGTSPTTTRRWLRLLPLVLVIAACVFSLVVLRSETTPANNLNDSAFHLEMVRWADHQIGEGKVPLDGWFPNLALGSSFFHHYQSLPYTLTAYAARDHRARRPDHVSLVPVPVARAVADLRLPRRAAVEPGAMARGRAPHSSRRSS